jgi:hypothetical protein
MMMRMMRIMESNGNYLNIEYSVNIDILVIVMMMMMMMMMMTRQMAWLKFQMSCYSLEKKKSSSVHS